MNTTRPFTLKKAREDGFTLTDLLVVIVTVAILGVLLLPALAGTKPNSQAFQCLENLRQLTLGWQMYAEDNNGKLARNGQVSSATGTGPTDPRFLPGGVWAQWCPGTVAAYDRNAGQYIKAGMIYPYVNNTNFYRCPSDMKAFITLGGVSNPQVRSYSMNCCLNPIQPFVFWNNPVTVRVFYKDTDFTQPGPSMTFVLIGENEGPINDTLFCCSPDDPNHWQDAPATRHAGAGGLSFADGHSEMKRWTDKWLLTVPTVFLSGTGHGSDPNSGDNAWLEQRVTVLSQ